MYSKIKNWQNFPIKKIDLFYYEDKDLNEDKFYKYKNGEFCHYSKEDIKNHIDVYNPETFLPFIVEFDIPFMPYHWIKFIQRAENQDNSFTISNVFGKYLEYCKLWGYRSFSFKDSERFQEL